MPVLSLKVPLQVMWIDKHHGPFIDSRYIVKHTVVPYDMNRCVLPENKSFWDESERAGEP